MPMENKKFWEEFIKLYYSHPCLWQFSHKDFSNRNKRQAAIQQLINKGKEINVEANRDSVIKRINNMRTSFRREWRKVMESKKLVCDGTGEVYKPTLWYYDLMIFTAEQDMCYKTFHNKTLRNVHFAGESGNKSKKHPVSGDDNTDAKHLDIDPLDMDCSLNNIEFECDDEMVVKQEYQLKQSNTEKTIQSPTTSYTPAEDNRSDIILNNVNVTHNVDTTKIATSYDNQNGDEFDVLGHHVAIQIRKITNATQRVYVQKIISDALFYAQLERLTEFTAIKLSPPQFE